MEKWGEILFPLIYIRQNREGGFKVEGFIGVKLNHDYYHYKEK